MPSTKIINVLRNDTFEDVFNSFLDTQAKEIIFIMPRGSRLIRNSKYFEAIKEEADNAGKLISIMTSDPIITEYAQDYGINLLNQDKKQKNIIDEEVNNEEDSLIDTPINTSSDFQVSRLSSFEERDDDEQNTEEPDTEEDQEDEEAEESVYDDNDDSAELSNFEEQDSPYSDRPIANLALARTKKKTATKKTRPTKTIKNSLSDVVEDAAPQRKDISQDIATPTASPVTPANADTKPIRPQEPMSQPQPLNPLSFGSMTTIDSILPTKSIDQTIHEDSSLSPYSNSNQTAESTSSFVSKNTKNDSDIAKNLSNLWLEKSPSDRKISVSTPNSNSQRSNKKPMSKLFFIGTALFIVVSIIIGYTYFGTAEVVAKPQTQDIDIQLNIDVDTNISEISDDKSVIPGKLFVESSEATESQDASSEREAAAKSSGTITIYNTESSPQKFIATTRFESPEGKIFRIDKSIEVPAGSKATPGTVKAKVFADKAGQEYNIEPARFTLPGLKNTNKYSLVYAISESPFSGGGIGLSKIVTEEDIATASSKSKQKLESELKDTINSKLGNLKIINFEPLSISSEESSVGADQVANSVRYVTKGSLTAIAFDENQLLDIILGKVDSNSTSLAIKDGTLKLNYEDLVYDTANGKMSFKVKASGTAYSKIDKEQILKEILGMPESAIKTYFNNKKEIESVQVIFSPFWLKSIPSDKSKVNLKIDI